MEDGIHHLSNVVQIKEFLPRVGIVLLGIVYVYFFIFEFGCPPKYSTS